MKFSLLGLLLLPALASAAETPWFRHAGEYLATRSTRMGAPTDVNTKVITDGKRFDLSIGKRIPLYTWDEQGPASAWSVGIDGGMLASLARYDRAGSLTFATNTFDGYFGAYIGLVRDGWMVMLRTAHLSAHMVDNNPRILTPVAYSQFWNEIILGHTFPMPEEASHWELHVQGSLGLNNTSLPRAKQPRASLGASIGYALSASGQWAVLASVDALRPGVSLQKNAYTYFLGLGSLNRPGSTFRPYRVGLAHYRGSDYRNQNYNVTHKFTAFEISAEF